MRTIALVLVLLVPFASLGIVQADDVPDDARRYFDQAKEFAAAGNWKKAYSAISKGRQKEPLSVDFWELYVRIWRGMEKPEGILWEKMIGKVEAKHPESLVFDLLRVRLAATSKERLTHLRAAAEKRPESTEVRVLMAKEYVAQGEDDEAHEILDAILEKDPGNETALVLKGDLEIASGFSRSALDFAREKLETYELPGLHALVAKALLQVAENDESVLAEAQAEAEKAVAGRADPDYVLVLADILHRQGKLAESVVLLEKHVALTGAPSLAARLGHIAFEAGDYAAAVKGLPARAAADLGTAKALAMSHARLGNAAEARAALKHVLAHDADEAMYAVRVDLVLGEAAASRAWIEGQEGDEATYMRAWGYSLEGNAAKVRELVGDEARDGSRGSEEYLLEVAKALVMQKLGGKAGAARKLIVDACFTAAKSKVPTATVPEQGDPVKLHCLEFMERYVTYFRCLGGDYFASADIQPIFFVEDGKPFVAMGVVGRADCERDPARQFVFNKVDIQASGGEISFEMNEEAWAAAKEAFAAGCAALVDGDYAVADTSFGTAVENEPLWARARLFLAAAKALMGADLEGAASEAMRAATELPDDWEGRRLGILIRTLAGQDAKAEAKALAEREEAHATRLVDEL